MPKIFGKIPSIEEASGWGDKQIAEALGHNAEIAEFKEEIAKLAALEGKARAEAEELWSKRLRPSIDEYSLKWIREDAIRAANPEKSRDEVLASTEPADIF